MNTLFRFLTVRLCILFKVLILNYILSLSFFYHYLLVHVPQSFLLQDLFINDKVSGEGLGVSRENDVGRVAHDTGQAALRSNVLATQHLHGRRDNG